jgi:hypothetical protein
VKPNPATLAATAMTTRTATMVSVESMSAECGETHPAFRRTTSG